MSRLLRHARGLLLVTHPVPSALYVVATLFCALIAAAAAHRPLAPGTLALALLCVACAQIAVGSFNDYCDRELDAKGQRKKPLVQGLIAPWEAVALGVAASVVVLVCGVLLGPVALVLAALIEGLGLAYDFRYKGTPVSGLLFAVYFPLFPFLAWDLFGRWQPFLPWLLPLGAALGIAMNVANSLPDLEDDLAAGVRGLPHVIGFRRGLLVAWGTPLAVLAVIWALNLTGAVPARLIPLLAGTLAVAASVAAAMALYRRRAEPATLRLTFTLQALGMLGMVGGWLAAVAF